MDTITALILPILLSAVVGYLLGSISFAILMTKLFANRVDVRDYGSGNAGATNVLRVAGKRASALTFVLDFLKCAAAVTLGWTIVSWGCASANLDPELARLGMYAAGFLCMIGHMYPLYFGFRGGKGVVTAAAMIALLDWRAFLICFGVFVLLFIWKRTVSLSSIVGLSLYPVVTFLLTYLLDYENSPLGMGGTLPLFFVVTATVVAALIGGTVVYKHKENIKRLKAGTEKKISFHKEGTGN